MGGTSQYRRQMEWCQLTSSTNQWRHRIVLEITRIEDSGGIRLGAAGKWAPAGWRGKYQGIELDSIIVVFSEDYREIRLDLMSVEGFH